MNVLINYIKKEQDERIRLVFGVILTLSLTKSFVWRLRNTMNYMYG